MNICIILTNYRSLFLLLRLLKDRDVTSGYSHCSLRCVDLLDGLLLHDLSLGKVVNRLELARLGLSHHLLLRNLSHLLLGGIDARVHLALHDRLDLSEHLLGLSDNVSLHHAGLLLLHVNGLVNLLLGELLLHSLSLDRLSLLRLGELYGLLSDLLGVRIALLCFLLDELLLGLTLNNLLAHNLSRLDAVLGLHVHVWNIDLSLSFNSTLLGSENLTLRINNRF